MEERKLEQNFKRAVLNQGGLALKLITPGYAGIPDRLAILPGGRVAFVEMKKPGGKSRPLQVKRHEQLRQLGCDVAVIDSNERLRAWLAERRLS